MPIYTSQSKGEIDTETMAQPHLERALEKAQRENNEENIQALQEELDIRAGNDPLSQDDTNITTEDTTETSYEDE